MVVTPLSGVQRLPYGLVLSYVHTLHGGCCVAFTPNYPAYSACCVFVASVLCTFYVRWSLCGLCPYPVYSAYCVVLLLFYVNVHTMMYGGCRVAFAPVLFTALAMWPLPLPCLQRLLCGFASIFYTAVAVCFARILFKAVAVWLCSYPVYSGCCVALPLSCCLYPVYSACCVILPLSCLQRLLCGLACVSCTAIAEAVWHCPYSVYSTCCVSPVEGLVYNQCLYSKGPAGFPEN